MDVLKLSSRIFQACKILKRHVSLGFTFLICLKRGNKSGTQHMASSGMLESWDPTQQMVLGFTTSRDRSTAVGNSMRAVRAESLSILASIMGQSGETNASNFKMSLDRLRDDWKQLIDAFQQLIWDSRELAGEAQALAADFVQVYYPRFLDQTVSLDIKLIELRDYTRGVEEHFSSSKRVRLAFATLTQRIIACEAQCSSMIPEYGSSARYQILRRNFKWILSELEAPRNDIFEGKGTYCVLNSIVPMLGRKGCLVPSYILDSDRNNDSEGLATYILAISSISIAVRVDLQRLTSHIGDRKDALPNGTTHSIQPDLHDDISRIKTFYESLIVALSGYQTHVVSPGARV